MLLFNAEKELTAFTSSFRQEFLRDGKAQPCQDGEPKGVSPLKLCAVQSPAEKAAPRTVKRVVF